jgi:hypothetical protein
MQLSLGWGEGLRGVGNEGINCHLCLKCHSSAKNAPIIVVSPFCNPKGVIFTTVYELSRYIEKCAYRSSKCTCTVSNTLPSMYVVPHGPLGRDIKGIIVTLDAVVLYVHSLL